MNLPLQVMDPEVQAAEFARVMADNEAKERTRVAAENRAKGYAEPRPGDRLYVSSGRGIRQRSRAGILFTDSSKTEVYVIGEFDGKPPGVKSVPVHGAEQILADGSLNVTGRSATDAEAADLRAQVADRDSEITKLKAENARILREVRMSTKDTGDGRPARLDAARKASRNLPDPDAFGGKD